MTWQDELQKLDNELASGRISADDYRRRRDEVLSGSAGGGTAAGQPQQGGAPFAPPFKWQAQQPAAPTSDATQVVNVQNQAPAPNPDATQVVTGNQQHRSQDAERTQFVAPVAPPPGQGGWGQPQQQAAPPPWVSGDFDQINQPGAWSHGPEVFDESGGGGKGKIIGIVLVVLVLAGLGFGAYWVWGRNVADPNSNQANGTTTTASSTKPSPPPDPLQVGKLAGNPKQQVEIASFDQVEKLNPPYLTPNEIEAYKTAGGARAKLFVASPAQGASTTVMIVSANDNAAANACAVDLKNVQVTNGMEAVTADVPDKVNVTQVPPKDGNPARIRGHYSSKKYVVRVDVAAATLADATTIFKDALDNQLKAMPADA